MLKLTLSLLLLALSLTAQPPAPTFPGIPLPIGIAVFGSYNQLGSPQWTGGVAAIYPVLGSIGLYGTTTTELVPRRAVDPVTGKAFWAISSAIRQGVHKDVFDSGRWSFLAGGDLGPNFAQSQSGVNVSLSTSFTATALFQITPALSAVLPIRMLYVSGIGWNPVVQAGLIINLKRLPEAK